MKVLQKVCPLGALGVLLLICVLPCLPMFALMSEDSSQKASSIAQGKFPQHLRWVFLSTFREVHLIPLLRFLWGLWAAVSDTFLVGSSLVLGLCPWRRVGLALGRIRKVKGRGMFPLAG